MRFLGAALALVLLQTVARADEGEAAGTGWHALLVGCTEYPVLRERLGEERYKASRIELLGPGNDVAEMRRALTDLFQVPDERITVLAGWTGTPPDRRPTCANIVAELDRLAKAVRKGDRVLVHMAGHGCQVPDADGDEMDGLDEVFLPADVSLFDPKSGTVPGVLPDDRLGAKVRAIRDAGAIVWLIMDCCHAGTMVRGADEGGIRTRRLDPELLGVPTAAARGSLAGGDSHAAGEIDPGGLGSIVAMYAAQSYRPAPEMPLPRSGPREHAKQHGLLTYMVLSRLYRAGGGLTFAELHEQVLAAYEALPFSGAVPLVEGDVRLRVFGEGRNAGPTLLVRAEGDRIALNAGQLAGMAPGTVLAVYEPLKLGDPAALLGGVEVVSAEPVRSLCRAVEVDGRKLPPLEASWRCPAQVRRWATGDLRLKVAAVDRDGRAREAPAAVLEAFGADAAMFALVPAAEAKWSLVIDGDAMWLEPARGAEGLRFEASPDTLADCLRRIFRAENLMSLAGTPGASPLPHGVEARMLRVDEAGETAVSPGSVLHPGDRVSFALRNGSGRIVDLALLHLDAHYGVTPVWPQDGASPRLTAADKAEQRIGPFTITDTPLGTERLLVVAVPRAEGDPVVDLTFLAQEPLQALSRGPEEDDVAALMRRLAFGGGELTRGLAPKPASLGMSMLVWRTEWGGLRGPEEETPMGIALRGDHLAGLMTDAARDPWQPASDPTAWRGDLSALYARAAPAIVVVRTRFGHGTGFLIDAEGHFLTNHHVVSQGFEYDRRGRPWVKLHRGKPGEDGIMSVHGEPLPAEVLHWDRARDLALLRVPDPAPFRDVRPIALAEGSPRPGQPCVMIGHPSSGLLWSLRDGHVSGVGTWPMDCVDELVARLAAGGEQRAAVEQQAAKMRQTRITLSSCQGNPGDSGGPLLDEKGSLLAVTHAIPSSARRDKFVYHIHLDEVRAFLASRPKPGDPVEPAVPDAWEVGPFVGLATTGAGGADVLIAEARTEEGQTIARQILLDVDDDSDVETGTPEEAFRLVSSRAFDAEIAIHMLPDRVCVFYDSDNDRTFDRVLVDLDRNRIADVAFALRGGRWTFDPDAAAEMLSTGHLEFLEDDARRLAMAKLRSLMQSTESRGR